MSRDVVVLASPAEVADHVAQRFLERLASVQAAGGIPHVALTGGTVARLVHRRIAARAPGSGVDWDRVVFWFGDERFVDARSEDRNAVQARADFLDVVGASRVHEVPARDACGGVRAAAEAYGDLLRAEGPGVFDLVFLGMGPDGHVASLFPGSPQLSVDDTIAVAVADSPKPPPERVSLTFPALNRARAVWFLVTGQEKAEATARTWAYEGSVSETPARGIAGPSITWFVDENAASG